MVGIPHERTLILSFGTPESVVIEPGKRSGPYLAVVAGRRELTVIRWDGANWHDGELVVIPVVLGVPALPPASDFLPA